MHPAQIINGLAAKHPIIRSHAWQRSGDYALTDTRTNLAAAGFLDCVHLKQASIPEILALKPNGALECRWLKYKIVDGSMREENKINSEHKE